MTTPTPPPAGPSPVPPAGQPPTATPPNKPKRRWWIPLVAGAAVLFLCCIGGVVAFSGGDDDTDSDRPSAIDTTDRDDNRAASRNDTADDDDDGGDRESDNDGEDDGAGEEPEPAPEPDSFGAGTWEIGAEIPAGTYVTVAPEGSFAHCYWARLSGFSGSFDDIIANDNLDAGARGRVTIDSSDAGIEFSGGCRWVEESEAPAIDIGSEFGPGVWRVGDEIEPGTYVTTAPEGAFDHCYWARLSGFSGDFDDIITNDNIEPGSRGRVEISSSDTGITFTGTCTWTRN